ncbi:MAG: sensor histidine kinase [Desulfovibrionaceae bacterium]|jgi:signal transduction histidine kinase|nr:sensor histidine kinase [Desulfovibrionaceae bacterium]
MNPADAELYDGLAFIGAVNASISHELKNVFAIASETSGLMGDLVELAQEAAAARTEGGGLDMDRFAVLCRRINEQMRRGNGILKTMNRFAHSVDEPLAEVDPADTAELMVRLCARFAAMRGVKLECAAPPDGAAARPALTASPFDLEHLLYRCLRAAIAAAGDGDTVTVSTRPGADGAALWTVAPYPVGSPPFGERTAALLARAGAAAAEDAAARSLTLTLRPAGPAAPAAPGA